VSHLATRRFTDRERDFAVALTCTLLIGLAVALTTNPPRPGTPRRTPAAVTHPAARVAARPQSPVAGAVKLARTFIKDYLRYLDGRGAASSLPDATAALTRSLAARPPLVSPHDRASRPRPLSFTATSGLHGLQAVRVLLSDDGPIDFQLTLLLARQQGRLLVAAVTGR
jgi:hypothetical protein